jgi:UDP-GlcNAc:undecaprenyl-phosphate GlcNAc-1-phosphate transferase
MSINLSQETFYFFKPILIGLFVALILTPIFIMVARRVGLIDEPGAAPHKQHARPTPIAGGMALMAAVFLSAWISGAAEDQNVRVMLLASVILFAFGVWDDLRIISAPLKLMGQFLATLVLINMGVSIRVFESPEFFVHGTGLLFVALDWLLTVVWVVGVTNAFNFTDSSDGLAAGLGATAAGFFTLIAANSQQTPLSQFSALLVGICAALYFFNAPPALMFLGDSGAQPLGFILAVIAIIYSPQGANQASSYIVPILILGVSIFDITLVVVSRLRRKEPVYEASHDHTYHRLLRMGLGPFRAVLLMQTTSLVLGSIAAVILSWQPLYANLAFFVVLTTGGLAILFLDQEHLRDPERLTDWHEERLQIFAPRRRRPRRRNIQPHE